MCRNARISYVQVGAGLGKLHVECLKARKSELLAGPVDALEHLLLARSPLVCACLNRPQDAANAKPFPVRELARLVIAALDRLSHFRLGSVAERIAYSLELRVMRWEGARLAARKWSAGEMVQVHRTRPYAASCPSASLVR